MMLGFSSSKEFSSQDEEKKLLWSYLPQSSKNGSILIITRNKFTARRLVGFAEDDSIIEVQSMSEANALTLFTRKLGKAGEQTDFNQAAKLVEELEFIPLAIVQEAALIRLRKQRFCVETYLRDFERSRHKRRYLFLHGEPQLSRDTEAKNSIIVTLQMSFDDILMGRPLTTELLSLMGFFDRQGNPEALLRDRGDQKVSREGQKGTSRLEYVEAVHADHDKDRASQFTVEDGFELAVQTLENYSFIFTTTRDSKVFEMHGLVQLAMQEWLVGRGQQEIWKEHFIRNLDAELPTGECKSWARCQTLFPHVQSALTQQPKGDNALKLGFNTIQSSMVRFSDRKWDRCGEHVDSSNGSEEENSRSRGQ
jgi:hypothetical protein